MPSVDLQLRIGGSSALLRLLGEQLGNLEARCGILGAFIWSSTMNRGKLIATPLPLSLP